jgi:serine/alanine adding enzyme
MSTAGAVIRIHLGPSLPDGLGPPDVYFTRGYGRAASIADSGEWVLVEGFDGQWQVPLIVRTLADGTKDAISPYGYSGIYASPSLSAAQVKAAWPATISALRDLGVISVLLRHSPLVPQGGDLPGLVWIVRGHPTIVLEPVDADLAWSAMEGNCRTTTRKALKHGYTGAVRAAVGADLEAGGDFRRLYEQTMRRLEADPLYFFGDDYYSELLHGLGPNLYIAQVQNQEGVVVSAALLIGHQQLLHYHLSGSAVDDARMGSNNLMIWTATQFAIDQGMSRFHLGGGVGPDDGLFKFKASFGGRRLSFAVSGLIVDEQGYQTHVERRAKECDSTAQDLLSTNYFPAYRAGGPAR